MSIEVMGLGVFSVGTPDPTAAETPQDVRYSYWPVYFPGGDAVVTAGTSLPLSGVKFSQVVRGTGEFRASLQLADDSVRVMNPWALIIPRLTGIVVVRSVRDPETGAEAHQAVDLYIVWRAPRDPATGRMEITGHTVGSAWAKRKISGPPPVGFRDPVTGDLYPGLEWDDVDQAQIMRDLLDPELFSQFGVYPGAFPGWITVDVPADDHGVLRTHSYRRGQNTNLLTAHQDRSKLDNGYEWHTGLRVLAGDNAHDATSYRVTMVVGYPRLPGVVGETDVPRFTSRVNGQGNVVKMGEFEHDSSGVASVMWGSGSGFDASTVRAQVWNSADWDAGFLITEEDYSNPDVSRVETLEEQTAAAMFQTYADERFIDSVIVRGDLAPHFGTYTLGTDCLLDTDDYTQPDNPDGTRGGLYLNRIMGWTVTPPEGEESETVELVLAGQQLEGEA